MDDMKFKILCAVRNATPIAPVRRSDFYREPETILSSRQHIEELLRCELLRQEVGSDTLWITAPGIIVCEQEENRRSEKSNLDYQLIALREMADAAKAEARAAEAQARAVELQAKAAEATAKAAEANAKAADTEAKAAIRESRRANRIAAASVLLSIVSWLFTKDDVRMLFSELWQWFQHCF